jgi:hypothetical protein
MKKKYTIEVEVEVEPKKSRSWLVGFTGHTKYVDGDKEIATAWPSEFGYRTYFPKHDNLTVNIHIDDTLENLINVILDDMNSGTYKEIEKQGEALDGKSP